MEQSVSRLKLRLELVWWLFTAILAAAVYVPIWMNNIKFPFYLENTVFIAVFVTAARYAFLLKHTWLAQMKWIKLGIIAVSVITVFVLITMFSDFNNYVEEVGLQEMVAHLHVTDQYRLIRYIQTETIFFAVGSAISVIVLSLRMIVSIWRMRNKSGKV